MIITLSPMNPYSLAHVLRDTLRLLRNCKVWLTRCGISKESSTSISGWVFSILVAEFLSTLFNRKACNIFLLLYKAKYSIKKLWYNCTQARLIISNIVHIFQTNTIDNNIFDNIYILNRSAYLKKMYPTVITPLARQ